MRENFELAVGFVLNHEGGYSQDPDDPGGETNFGISKKYHPEIDIKNLTKIEAARIYFNSYWIPTGDLLKFPKDIIYMDMAVNMGVKTATSILAESDSAEDMLFKRIRYYTDKVVERPVKLKYFFGWLNRVIELKNLVKDESKKRGL
jgi:hypothetical protein